MPQLHSETFATALRTAAGFDPVNASIEERLAQVPTIESLEDLPEGTPVWIRADLDVADHDGVIGDDPRRASLHETLEVGRKRGWRMLLIGHRGRAPESTLEYVYQKLKATEPGCGPFIVDWFDEHAETLTGVAVKGVESLKPGQFLDGGTSESNNNSSQISESNNLKSSQGELRFDLIKNLVKTEIPDDAEAENNPQNVQQEIFEQFNAQIEHSFSEQQQHLDEIFK